MNEIHQIKDELYSLYENIKNYIPKEKLPSNTTKNNENNITSDSIVLINYIKESIPLLLNQKISNKNLIKNDNNNHFSLEVKENNDLLKDYFQLENQLKKLEYDNKYYLKNYLKIKLQKDVLEMKLNAYISLEDEYEELKEKVKYEEGKFLDNDRKDNEIIIIRRENSLLKKEIIKLEEKNNKIDNKNKELQKKIKDLEKKNESLSNRIHTFEKIMKGNTSKNKSLSKEKNKSSVDLGIKNNDKNNKYTTSNNSNLKNIKTIYPQTLHFKKNKMHNIINFYSPKNDFIIFGNATTSNRINKLNYKKIQIPLQNEINSLKNIKNNSISVIKVEENKSTSINKYNSERNKKEYNIYNPARKIKIFNKILNSKPKSISPLSNKNSKNNKHIVHKYIHRDFNKNPINSFSQNIRANSNIN